MTFLVMLQATMRIILIWCLLIASTSSVQCLDNCSNCPGCSRCQAKVCQECHGGYLHIPFKPAQSNPSAIAVDAHCQKCTDTNCAECSGGVATCSKCQQSYGIVGGTCVACEDQFCLYCPTNISNCTMCKFYYGFNETFCVRCQDPNCHQCFDNYTQCTYCLNRTGVNELHGCSECSYENCSQCNSNMDRCRQCFVGGPGTDGICQPCPNQLCLSCPQNLQKCTSCTDNSVYRNQTYKCEPCNDPKCGYCKDLENVCHYCLQGYGWNINNKCDCQPPCQTCRNQSSRYCKTCVNDSFFQDFTYNSFLTYQTCRKCELEIQGCFSCSNSTFCTLCLTGFYLNTIDNRCYTCPFECSQCKWSPDVSSPQCLNCTVESQLTKNRPFLCGRYCDKTIKTGVRCNFEQGVKYDGCTNDCLIQTDFECFYQPQQVVSQLCSYTQKLKMDVVSIEREKFSNRMLIKIVVDPLLHVLTVLNSSKIFHFDSKALTKASVAIENQTGEMTIEADFNETLYNQTMQVLFKPSVKEDPRFRKTPQSQTSFQIIEVNFYSNFELVVWKTVFGLSYVAVGLGWSNLALGLVSKRLAGIETFVLFQMAFLTFLWIDLPLNEPLSQTNSLKYLNLPKIKELFSVQGSDQLSSANLTDNSSYSYSESVQKSPPHISNFDFQLSSFANNFNTAVIFQMVPLLIFMILALINCFFKYKIVKIIQETGDIPYTDEFTDSDYLILKDKVSKVEKGKELCAQCLMCFTTLNMIGLANALVLFLKYSTPPFDMNELIAIGICGGMFIITIILYFCDPDPFDYFRYAFRKQMLPLLTYFFFLVAFAFTIVLFFMFPHLSWAAMIPFSVFLLYTLAYRPHKQSKENYRAAFIILLILFVLGFRVFVQYSSKGQNNIGTYIYCLSIVIVLVLVGIATMIFLIYKIIYVCYILPQLEKSEKVKIMEEIDFTNIRQKMKFSNAEGSVFHQLMRNQMNIMDFSNSMRNLAIENNLDENTNQQNKTDDKKKNAWKEQPLTGKNKSKNKETDESLRVKDEDIQFHENFYNDFQKQNEKIQQNINENFEQYVKNRQQQEIGSQGEDDKQRRKKNFALQIIAEQNSFLGLKSAEQYVNEKKGETKDKNIFMDEYEKID